MKISDIVEAVLPGGIDDTYTMVRLDKPLRIRYATVRNGMDVPQEYEVVNSYYEPATDSVVVLIKNA